MNESIVHHSKDFSHLHAELEAEGEDENLVWTDDENVEDVEDMDEFEYIDDDEK